MNSRYWLRYVCDTPSALKPFLLVGALGLLTSCWNPVGSKTTSTSRSASTGNSTIAFTVQPASSGQAGTAFSASISVQASGGSQTYSGSVALALYSDSDCLTDSGVPIVSGGTATATDGSADFSSIIVHTAGTYYFGASAGSAKGCSTAVTVSAAAAATISIVSGNSPAQTGNDRSALGTPFVVVVEDTYSNPVSGATVTWAVTGGGGSLSSASNTTGANGRSSSGLTLGAAPGSNTVTATTTISGSPQSVTFTATSSSATFTSNLIYHTATSSNYTLSDSSLLQFTSSVARLTATTNQDQDDSSSGFGGGTSTGVSWNSTSMQLASTGPTNNSELSVDWTPEYSHILGYWRLNGTVGNIVSTDMNTTVPAAVGTDGTAVGPDSAIYGMSYVSGPGSGQNGISLDGGSYITLPQTLDPTGTFSFSAWVKRSDAGNSNWDPILGDNACETLGIGFFGNDLLSVFDYWNWAQISSAQVNISDSAWHYVTVTYDGANICFYADDGTNQDCQAYTGFSFQNRSYIVGYDSCSQGYFHGSLSDVAIWDNYGLTGGDRSLYFSGTPYSESSSPHSPYVYTMNSPTAGIPTGQWIPEINGNDGTAVSDVTLVPTVYADGKLNQGLQFAGAAAAVQIPNFDSVVPITISVWLKRSDAQIGDAFLESACGGQGWYFGWGYYGDPANHVCGGQQCVDNACGNTAITDTAWHHIVSSYDGSQMCFYLDGMPDGCVSYSSNFSSSGQPYEIGPNTFTSQPFGGMMDEVAIFDTVLTASEVAVIYNRQSANYAGTFNSRTFDAGKTTIWNQLTWTPELPYYKPLPNSGSEELTTAYAGLADSTLMASNIGLWHLDDSITIGSSTTVTDSSTGSHNGTAQGSSGAVSSIDNGHLNGAFQFDGSTGYVDMGNVAPGTDDMTLSAWIKVSSTGGNQEILSKESATSGYTMRVANKFISLGFWNGSQTNRVNGSINVADNSWHHIVGMRRSSNDTTRIYVDGVLDISASAGGSPVNDATHLYLGQDAGGAGNFFGGKMDEVAIWSRALTDAEVLQVYQRGASRLKFQTRTCASSGCSDDPNGANWKGPDGTASTYFSELSNTAVSIATASPSMTNNRYFQYRAIFETDSSSVANGPALLNVSTNTHYDNSDPTVTSTVPISFYDLTSVTETLGASCAGGVRYVLKVGSGSWYYWNTVMSAWKPSNGTYAQASPASTISTNASSFATQVGTGSLYVQAFLGSDGTAACELTNLAVSGDL